MSECIKVSVLTPIYNHKIEYVEKCLESLKNQTMQDIEFILIDNGATQESKDLIEKYLQLDSRFRALHIEKNQGYGYAMNLGLKEAKGEYITFLESDDWIESDAYDALYKFGIDNAVDVVVSQIYHYYGETGANYYFNKFPSCYTNIKLTKNIYDVCEYIEGIAAHWAKLYKNDFIKKYNIDYNEGKYSCPDVGFLYKSFVHAESMYISTKAFIHYRMDNNNSSIHSKDIIALRLLGEQKYITKYLEKVNADQKIWDIKFHQEFKTLENNYFNRCTVNKLRYLKEISKVFKEHIEKHNITYKYFDLHEIKYYKAIAKHPFLFYSKSFIENVFSVTNTLDRRHKVITVCGLKLKLNYAKIKPGKAAQKSYYNEYSTKIIIASGRYSQNGLLNEYDLIRANAGYWEKLNYKCWWAFCSALLEENNINEAKILLRRYLKKYDISTIHNFLPMASLAYDCGYIDDNTEKAHFVYNKLQENLQKSKFENLIANKSIAIVGNSGRELGKNLGNVIDSHDVVVRFNNFPKGYENDYGSKTNIWVHGIGAWENDIKDDRDLSEFDLVIWYQDIMKRFLSFNHLDILYRDLKEYPDKITYFPQKYHKMFGDEYDVYFPTSGGLAIYSIMKNVKEGQKVDIYGFSFIDNLEDNSHYYDKSCRLTKDHNIDNERQVLKQLTNLKVNLEEEKELVNV